MSKREHDAESSFDVFVRERGLTSDEIRSFIDYIGKRYDGPLYTRMTSEIRAYFRAWSRDCRKHN